MMRSGLPTTPATVADLCAVTGLSERSVRNAIARGDLPGSKVGERYVIPREAFDRYCRGEWVAQPRPVAIRPLPVVQLASRKVG